MPNILSTHPGDLLLMVGTRKGSFLIAGDPDRKNWKVSGPHHSGGEVFHLAYDHRNGGTIHAAVNYMIWGPQIESSHDLGQTWTQPKEQPRFSGEDGATVNRLWHLEPGRDEEPAVMYCGVEPAALFKSEDHGVTWQEVTGLSNHPTRDQWQPGFGGLCLHSIVLDPSDSGRMWVGISAVGVFGTSDGGQSWQTRNRGVRADFAPDPNPEFGVCPHKVLAHPARTGILYQQNHCGVYHSDDGGFSNGRTSVRVCPRGSGSSSASIPRTRKPCTCFPKIKPWEPTWAAASAT